MGVKAAFGALKDLWSLFVGGDGAVMVEEFEVHSAQKVVPVLFVSKVYYNGCKVLSMYGFFIS